jgi:formate hydrogenlyase subunit 6/NADH:ubiquinone oxidoreductase subunit I
VSTPTARIVVTKDGLAAMLAALRVDGHELIGPTVRDGAIVYAPIGGVDDLPAGVTDEQAPGHYRLASRSDGALFGYAVGPHSWKKELLVPTLPLVRIRRSKDGLAFASDTPPPKKRAFVGVRACEIAAIAIQDRVLTEGPFADADYAARRRDVFVVAVQCGDPGGTCFCASMKTGPKVERGYDVALTEIFAPHRFVVDVGSPAGAALVAAVPHVPAAAADEEAADRRVTDAASRMGRAMDTRGIRDLLFKNLEHPRWDDVASRCLGCTNCTLACPTCFCTTVEDRADLAGDEAVRERRWDSCFTVPFSHLAGGGAVRASLRSRYRQWLTHKLAGWIDQFGTSGCVGCGRCITWCPVGIDITAEVSAIRSGEGKATDA